MSDFTVIKRDFRGNDVLSYEGTVRERGDNFVCVDAVFGFSDRDLGYIHLRKGDLFTEWFFSDRWYNIFQVRDRETRQLKGWYCNITRPAVIEQHQVAADDLELDLFVSLDGNTLLLDEEEFEDLDLSRMEQQAAWDAVAEVRQMVKDREAPFDEIINENE